MHGKVRPCHKPEKADRPRVHSRNRMAPAVFNPHTETLRPQRKSVAPTQSSPQDHSRELPATSFSSTGVDQQGQNAAAAAAPKKRRKSRRVAQASTAYPVGPDNSSRSQKRRVSVRGKGKASMMVQPRPKRQRGRAVSRTEQVRVSDSDDDERADSDSEWELYDTETDNETLEFIASFPGMPTAAALLRLNAPHLAGLTSRNRLRKGTRVYVRRAT